MAAIEVIGSGTVKGIISILFGVLVLGFPKFLRYTIGIYFILIGLLSLL